MRRTWTVTASSPFIVECLPLDADGRVFSFYTRRGGGCSTVAYASMNCTHYCGDSMDNVMANRATLIAALPHTPQRLLLPRQVHGVKVHDLRPDDLRLGDEGAQHLLDGVDAIVTAVKGVCIAVSTADCVPLLAYSPEGVMWVMRSMMHSRGRVLRCRQFPCAMPHHANGTSTSPRPTPVCSLPKGCRGRTSRHLAFAPMPITKNIFQPEGSGLRQAGCCLA